MGSLREWHHLKPIEQTLAEWVYKGPVGTGLDARIEGMLSTQDLAVKYGNDGVVLYRIPADAIRQAQGLLGPHERVDKVWPGGSPVPYGERA